MSKIDAMSTTSQAESPTYIPSSCSPSPNPLPIPGPIPEPPNDPISPQTIINQLRRDKPINSVTLQGICKSLCVTIRTREDAYNHEKAAFTKRIKHLEERLKEHEESFQWYPEGYKVNTRYLGLKINISFGLHRPVKWIKLLNKGTIAGFCDDDGPGSSPHILKIYAQLMAMAEPIKPLPPWFETILLGLSPMYHNFAQAAGELKDWGIKADIQRFRDTDTLLVEANNKVAKWEERATAFAHACQLCKSRLEAAHTLYQLGAFENLGPVRAHAQLTRCGCRFSPALVRGRNNVGGE